MSAQLIPAATTLYDRLAVLRSREHHLRELQHLWPAELIDADCFYSWYLLPLEGHMVRKVRDPPVNSVLTPPCISCDSNNGQAASRIILSALRIPVSRYSRTSRFVT